MGTTSNYGFPYPEQGDVPNVQADIKSLASSVDNTLAAQLVSKGIPQPVVNGQWIKGSGGAAIWSAITQADFAGTPLAQVTMPVPGNDCNQAQWNGWYYAQPGTANMPASGIYGALLVHNISVNNSMRQVFHQHGVNTSWERYCNGGTWSAWWQTGPPIASTGGANAIQAQVVPTTTVAFPANDASGNSGGTLPLPVAWPNAHLGFAIGYMWPYGHWSFYIKVVSTSALNAVTFQMNQAGAQNMGIGGISFGY